MDVGDPTTDQDAFAEVSMSNEAYNEASPREFEAWNANFIMARTLHVRICSIMCQSSYIDRNIIISRLVINRASSA
ncbi:hypothetical protein PILCRDRAFT_810710 [Piloderma croceum F 1598]|uniref:Uncharacterized protein n=1 Tax=Piloderma croceum (strain F 1598) TaxID=765440 RepID=A0A0C3BY10_PILCF|nr:hypothetical protein PILCRDRAFT_810710 [Piloderma croceum F 1598]